MKLTFALLLAAAALLVVSGCQHAQKNLSASIDTPGEIYATSLLGKPLYVPKADPKSTKLREENLEVARERYLANPQDEDAIIWLGRRLAYLFRYEEAIDVFTKGLAIHPRSFRLLRHRGHRLITVRKLARAISDLEKAADLAPLTPLRTEEDGIPNASGTPISTTQGNIYYHLGLARYLAADFAGALTAYDVRFNSTDRNNDNHCSTAYWRFLILKRLGRDTEAHRALSRVTDPMDVIENATYRDLVLLYGDHKRISDFDVSKDGVHSDSVANSTLAYGLSMSLYLNGNQEHARRMWHDIVGTHSATSAFGYIAAEAELVPGR